MDDVWGDLAGLRWQAEDPLEGASMGMTSILIRQGTFRFRNDDGGELVATWKAANNTSITQLVNEEFRLRITTQEYGGEPFQYSQRLQYSINGGGFSTVTTTSSEPIYITPSQHQSSDVPATRQLDGSGTFATGRWVNATETGMHNPAISANGHTEFEWTLRMNLADFVDDDVVTFRILYRNTDIADDIAQTPSLTVQTGPTLSGGSGATVQVSRGGGGEQLPDNPSGGAGRTVQVSPGGGGTKSPWEFVEYIIRPTPDNHVELGDIILLLAAGGGGGYGVGTTTNEQGRAHASLTTAAKDGFGGSSFGLGGADGQGGGNGTSRASGGGGYLTPGEDTDGRPGSGGSAFLNGGQGGDGAVPGGYGGGGSNDNATGWGATAGGGGYSGGGGGYANTNDGEAAGGGGASFSREALVSSSVDNQGDGYAEVWLDGVLLETFNAVGVGHLGSLQLWAAAQEGSYRIKVAGAQGGTETRSGVGGYGAVLEADFLLREGDELYFLVGHEGTNSDFRASGGGGTFVALVPFEVGFETYQDFNVIEESWYRYAIQYELASGQGSLWSDWVVRQASGSEAFGGAGSTIAVTSGGLGAPTKFARSTTPGYRASFPYRHSVLYRAPADGIEGRIHVIARSLRVLRGVTVGVLVAGGGTRSGASGGGATIAVSAAGGSASELEERSSGAGAGVLVTTAGEGGVVLSSGAGATVVVSTVTVYELEADGVLRVLGSAGDGEYSLPRIQAIRGRERSHRARFRRI